MKHGRKYVKLHNNQQINQIDAVQEAVASCHGFARIPAPAGQKSPAKRSQAEPTIPAAVNPPTPFIAAAKSRSRPCSIPPLSPTHPAAASAAHRQEPKNRRGDGVGAVLPALRRQPLGGGHLRRDGRALRGHLLASHLPHRHLRLPPRLHRTPLTQAGRHEVRLQLLRRCLLLRAGRVVAG